jgi:signal transduction histidine kinase
MVTRKLIEEDGGSIEVDSTPGEGTTVTVRLPFELSDAA